MEDGSPSRRSWADECDELPSPRELGAGSPRLEDFLGRGPGERVSLIDSEEYSDEDEMEPPSPPPQGKRKEVAEPSRKRRRARRHRRRAANSNAFMTDARRTYPTATSNPPPARSTSPPCHPARQIGSPDADGFYQVRSRRVDRLR